MSEKPFFKPVLRPPRPTIKISEDDIMAEIDPETGNPLIEESDIIKEEPVELSDDDFEEVDTEKRHSNVQEITPFTSEPGMLQTEAVIEAESILKSDGVEIAIALAKKEGRTQEQRNEDNVLVYKSLKLGVVTGVMDALGGESGNEQAAKASALVEELLPRQIELAMKQYAEEEAIERLAEIRLVDVTEEGASLAEESKKQELIKNLNPEIGKKAFVLAEALRQINEYVIATEGKTTACITIIHTTKDGKRFAITANVGDSGAFLQKENGTIKEITVEDSLANALIGMGRLTPEKLQELKEHPEMNFMGRSYKKLKLTNTQALGSTDAVKPSISIIELEKGDSVVLATDGMIDFFENEKEQETDLVSLGASIKGETTTERLDTLQQILFQRQKLAQRTEKSYKDRDDSAIVLVRVTEESNAEMHVAQEVA